MIVLQPKNDQAWLALDNVLAADLYVAVHLTLSGDNLVEVMSLIERLANIDVKAISLTTSDPSFETELQKARDHVSELDLDLIWNMPVPYSARNPVALETAHSEERGGAGRAWLYLEPDGDVLPAQGINRVLGNILEDEWEKIWMNAHSGE